MAKKRVTKPKVYTTHEFEYRRMAAKGIDCWNARQGLPAIEPCVERFLLDVLDDHRSPRSGAVLEVGCGTGPLVRWFADRGFRGTGIDISPSAIRLARQATETNAKTNAKKITYRVGDATNMAVFRDRSFNIVVDGLCLHCLTSPHDRAVYVAGVARVLRPGGIFIVHTMAAPVLRAVWPAEYGVLKNQTVYVPSRASQDYEGAVQIKGQWHMPTRRMEHWKTILTLLQQHGLHAFQHRLAYCSTKEPNSTLSVAAQRPS